MRKYNESFSICRRRHSIGLGKNPEPIYAYINPVIALFLGWIVLDEKLNFQIAIAAAVILAGVFTVKKGTARLKHSR
jgi:drug/metabolite transporter (DMT)-like permease